MEPDASCVCGHVWDEHDPRTASCTMDDCRCGGFEQEEDDDSLAS